MYGAPQERVLECLLGCGPLGRVALQQQRDKRLGLVADAGPVGAVQPQRVTQYGLPVGGGGAGSEADALGGRQTQHSSSRTFAQDRRRGCTTS